MAGEYCGRGCAWCGRCDAEPEDRCDCGRSDCSGDCSEPTAEILKNVDSADLVEAGR
jgi:hypothetical protein